MLLKNILTTRNVGTFDRVLRLLIAVAIGLLWSQGLVSGTLGAALGAVALVMVFTALNGTCGLYYLFGWSTCSVKGGAGR